MRIENCFILRAIVALAAVCIGCSQSSGTGSSDGGAANDKTGGAGNGTTTAGASSAGARSVNGGTTSEGGARGGTTAGGGSGNGGAPGSGGRTAVGGRAGSAGDGASGSAGVPNGEPPEPEGRLTVFYLDVGGRVMATDVQEPRARTIVEDAGRGPDGLALDMEEGHIYWTGMGVPAQDDGFVMRSDLDGSNMVTIVPPGGTYTPKQLRIDRQNGKLYWSDREGMRVMRANLDGSTLETLVITGTTAADRRDESKWCVGIALDVAGGYFYWSQKGPENGSLGSLRRARLSIPQGEDPTNRSDMEVLFSGLPEPIDIDLDLENRFIYWTDRGDDTINRASIEIPNGATAATRMDREVVIEGVREAIGITLDMERGKLYFTGGTGGRVGMANLDGSGVMNLLTGRAGLTGIVVVEVP